MRFGRRSAPAASYAVLVAERHLWLVLDRPGRVSLRGAEVPVSVEEQHGHHGVGVDLDALPVGSHDVLLDSRPLTGPEPAPAPAGARTVLERDRTGRLVVVRAEAADPGPTVRRLRLLGEAVGVELAAPRDAPATTWDAARLVDADGRDVAVLPVDADGSLVIGPAALADAPAGDLRVLVGEEPVRRRDSTLVDPGAGALLPAVHPAGAEHARARLRWSDRATLVVRVHG